MMTKYESVQQYVARHRQRLDEGHISLHEYAKLLRAVRPYVSEEDLEQWNAEFGGKK